MFHSILEENNFLKNKAAYKENSKSINKLTVNEGMKSKGSVVFMKSLDKEGMKFIKGNLKILKNESTSAKQITDSNKDKLTFDSVFSKNFTTSATLQSPIVPINININNFNINNYNIKDLARKSNTSGNIFNSSKKIVNNQFNPPSTIHQKKRISKDLNNSSKNLHENINSSLSNFKQNNIESFPLPKICSSNNDLMINPNNSLKKKIITHKIGLKLTPHIYLRKNENEYCNTDRTTANKEINENENPIENVEKKEENIPSKKLHKKKVFAYLLSSQLSWEQMIKMIVSSMN